MPESYDVYLVLHPLRGSIARFRSQVQPLGRIESTYLGSAEIFYHAATDTALLGLCFTRRAVSHLGDDAIHLLAHRSRLPMIVPACMDARDRRRFLLEHLSTCEVHVPPCPAVDHARPAVMRALDALAEELADLPVPLPLPMMSEATGDLPLFRPWWQRRATSQGLDATGC